MDRSGCGLVDEKELKEGDEEGVIGFLHYRRGTIELS
jgi:hypothetical protein